MGIRTCHARCCYGVEPEKRSKSNKKKYYAGKAVRNRSFSGTDSFGLLKK